MKLPGLRLRLATSQLIRQWAQRQLPNGKIISGQILNPKTINYQTLKPEKDGLFCERIFGPINDSICACGRPLRGQKFCPRCEVEYISTRVRRYRLGYIQLVTATAHIWFFKGRPSYFSLFLNLSKKKIEGLLYCTKNISRTIFPKELESLNFYSLQKFNGARVGPLCGLWAKPQLIGSPKGTFKNSIFCCPHPPGESGYWNLKKLGPSFPLEKDGWVILRVWTLPKQGLWPANKVILRLMDGQKKLGPLPGSAPWGGPLTNRIKKVQQISPRGRRAYRPREDRDKYWSRFAARRAFISSSLLYTLFKKIKPSDKMITFGPFPRPAEGESPIVGGFSPSTVRRADQSTALWLDNWALQRWISILFGAVNKAPGASSDSDFIKYFWDWIREGAVWSPQSGPILGWNRLCTASSPPKVQALASRLRLHLRRSQSAKGQRPQLIFQKKSRWQEGGLRDSALYFGFSLVSKMFSWQMTAHWFSFVYFLIQSPFFGDLLNKFYPGPLGLVHFWGLESRLFCSTGVQLMRTWLTQLTQNQCHDGRLLEIQIRLDLLQLEGALPFSDNDWAMRAILFRRFKYLRSFRHTHINPASMILSVLPVLPPDLRPILQLDNNQMAISDLNQQYQTVLLRNKRLSRLTMDQNSHCLNSEALQYSQRLLQESVDALIDNGKLGPRRGRIAGETERPLKSLSDLFKGKKGRFRQNLLGKRVDYSGRSVIVVGPYLKIYECGLPKEMAYELFQPFLLRILLFQNQAQTILGAKKLLQQKPFFIWGLLKEVVHSHPILLNRAPSLHRLNIQAFQPRLIEGKAILLHPLVCAAFNADFDGDQMGVHLPLCFEARGEAWKITWSQNHLFSVATGSPTCSPSQDMILGSSFLTMQNHQKLGFEYLLKIHHPTGSAASPPTLKNWQSRQFIKWLLAKGPVFFQKRNQSSDLAASYFDKKSYLSEITLPVGVASASPSAKPDASAFDPKPSFSEPLGAPEGGSRQVYFLSGSAASPLTLVKKTFLGALPFPRFRFLGQNTVINDPIWCSYNPILNQFETEKKKQKLIEIRINLQGHFQKFRSQFIQQYHSSGVEIIRKIRTIYGRIKFYESLAFFE